MDTFAVTVDLAERIIDDFCLGFTGRYTEQGQV